MILDRQGDSLDQSGLIAILTRLGFDFSGDAALCGTTSTRTAAPWASAWGFFGVAAKGADGAEKGCSCYHIATMADWRIAQVTLIWQFLNARSVDFIGFGGEAGIRTRDTA